MGIGSSGWTSTVVVVIVQFEVNDVTCDVTIISAIDII